MGKTFRAGERAFLNQDGFHEDASLSYTFTVSDRGYFDGEIVVRDCGEGVRLSIDAHNEEYLKNSRYKLDTMIEILKAAKKDLTRARRALVKAKKEAESS